METNNESHVIVTVTPELRTPISMEELKQEDCRLATFTDSNYNSPRSRAIQFAELGYYYNGQERKVICIFCNFQISESQIQDHDENVHRLSSCPFASGQGNVGNVRLNECEDYGDYYIRNRGLRLSASSPTILSPSSSRPVNQVVESHIHSVRRRHKLPHNPNMFNQQKRLDSFENWPSKDIISTKLLTEAGFYYTGYGNETRCFHCNGKFDDWKVNDDPWSRHAFYYQKCHFVYLKRGQVFSKSVVSPNKESTPLPEAPEPSKETDRYTCKICWEKEIATVLVPCDHSIACVDCVFNLDKCPFCKISIRYICKLNYMN